MATKQAAEVWSSKWAFIIAATGAAVGLGNIWRFPYMAGSHGGSAFVLLYLIFVVLIGMPIMAAEILIGKRGRQNPVDSLKNIAVKNKHSKHWSIIGWGGALALLLVLSFYSVVSGWSIAYIFYSFSGHFNGMSATQVVHVWNHFLADPWRLLMWHTIFISLTMGVITLGVQQGLERATKFMMPALYLILISLVVYAGVVGNFREAIHFLFDFHLSQITGSVVIAAMGHAFFTLALGAGAMLMYGAYVPKDVKIIPAVGIVVVLDVLVAVLSGLAIFPIVFAHNLPAAAGPGLMFESLPISFANITGGSFVGGLFFVLLLFAAWTSSINLAEPMVAIVRKKLNVTRGKAALLIGFLAWFIGIGSLLSFNVWDHLKLFHKFSIFSVATNLPTDIILPLGGFGFAIFAGYIMTKRVTKNELNDTKWFSIWRFLVRYVAPAGILIVFIASVW